MPTELYWFEAPEDARLEIWTMSGPGQILHVRGDVRDYIVKDKPQASTLWAC